METALIINLIISFINIVATALKSYQLRDVRQRVRIIESSPPSTPSQHESVFVSGNDVVVHVPSRVAGLPATSLRDPAPLA